MMDLVRGVALIGALLVLSGLAHAQSLGEIARQEQQKKKKQAPASPAPTYNGDDLTSRAKPKATGSETPVAASPTPQPSAEPSPASEPDRKLLEREWRARFAEARARIAEADARAYEDRIDVVYHAGILVQQRVRVKVETAELREAKKTLEDLEEELRRSGGLPGWGRE
jgi:hypothetical protein